MIRVTLKDSQQTISFLSGEDIAQRLVAACSANPTTIGDLLLAAEIFRRGIAAAVMVELMAFDKALRSEGPTHALDAVDNPDGDDKVIQSAFQVVDEQTAALAFDDGAQPLLICDLPQRTLHASRLTIQPSGELLAHTGTELTDRAITYLLPKHWIITTIAE